MPGKVFISCGQASDAERMAAREVAAWFHLQGFTPYVATQVQSILDLNLGIVGELKASDYYLFVNFRREQLPPTEASSPTFRGSLYTNQELAIAYALGFEKMLFLNQRNAERAGMFGTIVSNSQEFDGYIELLPAVQAAVQAAEWTPSYSRQLLASRLRLAQIVRFGDHTGQRVGRTLHIDIENRRPDLAATHCAARLRTIHEEAGTSRLCFDQSPLKITGQPGYSQSIWPETHGAFDLLSVSTDKYPYVFLNSALDVSPRQPVITDLGTYRLEYEVYAEGFPKLSFAVELQLAPSGPNASLI